MTAAKPRETIVNIEGFQELEHVTNLSVLFDDGTHVEMQVDNKRMKTDFNVQFITAEIIQPIGKCLITHKRNNKVLRVVKLPTNDPTNLGQHV